MDVMMSKRTEKKMGVSFFISAGREIGDGH
jgi:hypothetical protein